MPGMGLKRPKAPEMPSPLTSLTTMLLTLSAWAGPRAWTLNVADF